MTIENRIGAKLKEKAGDQLNIQAVARETGLGYSTIVRAMSGENTRIDLKVVDRLCEYIGCQPGDLFTHKPDEPAAGA